MADIAVDNLDSPNVHNATINYGAKNKKLKRFKRYIPLYFLAVPGLLYLLINNYFPLAGLFIAFKNINYSKGIFGSDWVGLQNFEFLFKTSDAWIITRNTLAYNASFIVLSTIGSIAMAVLLNEVKNKFAQRLYQTVILIPVLISMVIVAYLAYAFLSPDTGFINNSILKQMGIPEVNWYDNANAWPGILTYVYLWKNLGQSCILYFAAILGIDKDYYEAADLDGASTWVKIRKITLPLIRPVVITMVLLAIGKIFYADFGLFYQVTMNSGSIYSTTNVIDTYVFRGLMQLGDIGMSSAAGFYQSVVGFVLVLLANFAVRKIDSENALF
jgi:putative aldouronate transport system permease protein